MFDDCFFGENLHFLFACPCNIKARKVGRLCAPYFPVLLDNDHVAAHFIPAKAHAFGGKTSISSKEVFGSGKGQPWSCAVRSHPSIASAMFCLHSSRVSPWLTQPGRSGTETVKPPSGWGAKMIPYFMSTSLLIGARCSSRSRS